MLARERPAALLLSAAPFVAAHGAASAISRPACAAPGLQLRSQAASEGSALAWSAWAMLRSVWGSGAVDRAASGTGAPSRGACAASSFCRRRSRSRLAFSKFLALRASVARLAAAHAQAMRAYESAHEGGAITALLRCYSSDSRYISAK